MVSLRELRAERLLSIRELARQASVAPSTIFLIEAGRTIPRQRVARQIAAALQIDPSEIDEFRRRIEVEKSRHIPFDPSRAPDDEAGLQGDRPDSSDRGSSSRDSRLEALDNQCGPLDGRQRPLRWR
ncbi:MAG: helix-turn-helix transcriptional regulator [Chloroflexi bacterium]|nr:helix-turn-helix transcriptional regulator [Chloroflexota bacterium]